MMGTILLQPCTLPFSLATAQTTNQDLPVHTPLLEVDGRGQSVQGWKQIL